MCRCRLTELNWVSTKIRFSPELMQLEMGMSISRYFPAIGTAGLLRDLVSGNKRVPRPPPRINEMTRGMKPLLTLVGKGHPSGLAMASCKLPASSSLFPSYTTGKATAR